jgi:phosphoglycolate phosphatase-like HAD superfamily hydrolase
MSDTRVGVFDFDGVWVRNSDAVHKKEAWRDVLMPWEGRYEPHLAEVQRQYGSGKRGGRREILTSIFEKLKEPKAEDPEFVENILGVYDTHVQKRILEEGLVEGALLLLSQLKKRGLVLYLNSGTPTGALMRTARNLKIEEFFTGILGSTSEPIGGSKVENLIHISADEGAGPSEILMVGDSDPDYEAAKEVGTRFVGVGHQWNNWNKEQKPFPVITDLRDITKFL